MPFNTASIGKHEMDGSMFRFVNQVLPNIILNGFFQAVLFALIFLVRLLWIEKVFGWRGIRYETKNINSDISIC